MKTPEQISFLNAKKEVVNYIVEHFKNDIINNTITWDYCYQLSMIFYSCNNQLNLVKILATSVYNHFRDNRSEFGKDYKKYLL